MGSKGHWQYINLMVVKPWRQGDQPSSLYPLPCLASDGRAGHVTPAHSLCQNALCCLHRGWRHSPFSSLPLLLSLVSTMTTIKAIFWTPLLPQPFSIPVLSPQQLLHPEQLISHSSTTQGLPQGQSLPLVQLCAEKTARRRWGVQALPTCSSCCCICCSCPGLSGTPHRWRKRRGFECLHPSRPGTEKVSGLQTWQQNRQMAVPCQQ